MPKRQDLKKILIVGAGPIVIGQACEFDYSGTQACRALKQEGYEIVLVNSNPATIMTDPDLADRTYIEPIVPEVIATIIEKERPDALLPTMGGQTSLNIAIALAENGVLDKYGVELIGARLESIHLAEDRALFKKVIDDIGLESPRSETVCSFDEGLRVAQEIAFPIILRPAFTLGGSGGGIAYEQVEFESMLRRALTESPASQVLLEEDLSGWKEYELEVVRDQNDNVIIVCSIENLDPMGIHTGDSITVAPAQTLTDVEYQNLRDQAIKIIRAIGVDSGGSNIQFAVNPRNGRIVIIEMNPRVSRSSALASKATGYPIAKIAAKLAVGYTLDELPNEITKTTSAAFEPSIDYVVTKIPRFAFAKFPDSEDKLGTQMKSVGEVMAIGRTFCESFQKALRGLETGWLGFGPFKIPSDLTREKAIQNVGILSSVRLKYVWQAMKLGATVREIHDVSQIDIWFLTHMYNIYLMQERLLEAECLEECLQELKENGFSDAQIASIRGLTEVEVYSLRKKQSIQPVYKIIDTCAGEIASETPYSYSTYDQEDEVQDSTQKPKVMIIGGGPNRIGQGIEFDYCCVHASMVLRDSGYETIMVNSNPETVSTDFDVSDRLYFEPVTVEDVAEIYRRENPIGAIVQLGGQTPLNISWGIRDRGCTVLGTSVQQIEQAEDRDQFSEIVDKLSLNKVPSAIAHVQEEVVPLAEQVGYPVLVRPSFVIGGQAMQTVYSREELEYWLSKKDEKGIVFPVLIDKFLDGAVELDVDSVSDGSEVIVAGILEHTEKAGIHSGDSACTLPPQSISEETTQEIIRITHQLAKELQIVGLMNIQFALKDNKLYVLEVNPRASRTVPFISKVTGLPWAKIGTLLMVGKKLSELKESDLFPGLAGFDITKFDSAVAVKEVVLPFKKFPGCEISLGPEMRSTGEVMGIDKTFGMAFAKSQLATYQKFVSANKSVFLSVNDGEKASCVSLAQDLEAIGYKIYCTEGTFDYLSKQGITTNLVRKATQMQPNILSYLTENKISILINLPKGDKALKDNMSIRRLATLLDLPLITTLAGAEATVEALKSIYENGGSVSVCPLQDFM